MGGRSTNRRKQSDIAGVASDRAPSPGECVAGARALAFSTVALATAFALLAVTVAVAAPDHEPVTAAACAIPEALTKAGEDKEARKAYVEDLKADPSSSCALEGLKKLNAPTPKSSSEDCDLGNAYLDLNRNDDAIEAFKAGLAKDVTDACAKEGLEEAGPSWLTRSANEVAGWIPTIALIIGLVLLAFYLVLLLGHWRRLKWLLEQIWKLGPLIGRILGPRLTISNLSDDSVDGKPGNAVTTRVKERLGRMRSEALSKEPPEYHLDLSTPREDFADLVSGSGGLKSALDNASDISDQGKVVAAVLNIVYVLLPIRRFEISGTLEPPASTGAAATLILEEGGGFEAAATLQSPPPASGAPGAADYMQLADPAAVWIQYEVARSLNGEDPKPAEAESQALVRDGLGYYAEEQFKEARACYEKALRLNRRNWAAYVCLAVAEARIGDDFPASIQRSAEGFEAIKEESGG
jgi:tetratricopeptide (TPR) repeat protein